jgi:hypothetical protein
MILKLGRERNLSRYETFASLVNPMAAGRMYLRGQFMKKDDRK